MNEYKKILANNKNFALKYVQRGSGASPALSMAGNKLPISIKLFEFNFIKDLIVENNLQYGYEIATGTGLSAVAAGLGFKETGGKIVTMDAFVEEYFKDMLSYMDSEMLVEDSKGFKSVNQLIKFYELEDIVYPKIGWSPTNTEENIRDIFKNINNHKLDYIFIDSCHHEKALKRDFESIQKFVKSGTYVLFHDTHVFPSAVKKIAEDHSSMPFKVVVPMPEGYNLGMIIIR